MSYNYEISGGVAKMKDTYPLWTDPSLDTDETDHHHQQCWERRLYNYALHLRIPYDSEMRSDYGDLRFKHEG